MKILIRDNHVQFAAICVLGLVILYHVVFVNTRPALATLLQIQIEYSKQKLAWQEEYRKLKTAEWYATDGERTLYLMSQVDFWRADAVRLELELAECRRSVDDK